MFAGAFLGREIIYCFCSSCRQWMNAGTRKASARIHASGLAKQAAEKPNIGTNTSPMSERAIISATPANIAKPEKPMPCMVKRTVFTRTSGM